MKAVTIPSYGTADQLQLDQVEKPVPGDQQLLIKVCAAGVNRADILQRKGYYPPPSGASEIMGLEVSGEVVEAGSKAQHWLGKSVMGLLSGGGYAEYVAVDQGLVLPVPAGLDIISAAGVMEAFLTAYQALHWLAKLQPHEKLLIHAGGSGVGTAAIQLARMNKAVIWITASKSKHSLCTKLGADHCIDYHEQEFAEIINQQLPEGVDIVMDFIGAPYFSSNLKCLTLDGRLVMQGFMGGSGVSALDLAPILKKRLKIMGSTLRSRSLLYRQELIANFKRDCYLALKEKLIFPVIDRVFSIEQVADAHRYMEENRNGGKILLKLAAD